MAGMTAAASNNLLSIGHRLGANTGAKPFLWCDFFDVLEVKRVAFLEELHGERHLSLIDKLHPDKGSEFSGDLDIEGLWILIDIARIPGA